jgi:hypothetical protein
MSNSNTKASQCHKTLPKSLKILVLIMISSNESIKQPNVPDNIQDTGWDCACNCF